MSTATLTQAQHLVDTLSLPEQVQLLEYLTPKIRDAVDSIQAASLPSAGDPSTGWNTLFHIGAEIAQKSNVDSLSPTQTLLEMRR